MEVACAYTDKGKFPQAQYPLSDKVTTFDLDVHTWEIHGSMTCMLKKFFPRIRKMLSGFRLIIGQWRPDIVVSVGSYEKYAIPLLFKKAGGKKFKTLREYHFASNYRCNDAIKPLQARFLTWIDQRVIPRLYDSNCLLTEADMNDNFPDRPSRMRVVPNPITCRIPDGCPSERENTVVFVGRLAFEKNPELLLEVWEKVKRNGWKLRIVGDGEYRKKIKQLISNKNLGDSVELAGWVSDVTAELQKAKIFMLTSRYEGFGLALLEAMANGVVPVSMNCPYGPSDIISNGVDGFLVENRDVNVMAQRITALMDDSAMFSRMSEAALRRSRDFSIEKIAARWVEEYRRDTEK